jgi:hypothetical protein
MSKVRGIIKTVEAKDLYNKKMQKEYEKLVKRLPEKNEDIHKDENEKRHERYLRNIKRRANGVNIEVKPAKILEQKPGTYFYGNLSKLVKDFKNLEDMFKYMTLGQMSKYYEKEGKLWSNKTQKVVYDPSTGEVFE